METELAGWTAEEQALARQVFDLALRRQVEALIESLRMQAAALGGPEDVWQFHDFLSIQRHTIEGRMEFRIDGLLFVFAGFVKDGLTSLEELEGLSAHKQAKIRAMSRMCAAGLRATPASRPGGAPGIPVAPDRPRRRGGRRGPGRS